MIPAPQAPFPERANQVSRVVRELPGRLLWATAFAVAGEPMFWTLRRARLAAGRLRREPLAAQVLAAARPRSVLGLVRCRAPLAMQLFLASRDGLLAELGDGFAVLRRPATAPPITGGGWPLRLARRVDRHWDVILFAGPPITLLLTGTACAPQSQAVALAAALLALLWVAAFMAGMLAAQLCSVARHGRQARPGSLPRQHWSVPLFHQPEPGRAELLAQRLTQQMAGLIRADLQETVSHTARVGQLDITETIVVLLHGITTEPARAALARSAWAIGGDPACSEVILLASPGRLDRVPARRVTGGGFLLLYLSGMGLAVTASAGFVARHETASCLAAASCAGRPASYGTAVRWLLQRLLFSDPPGLAPGTLRDAVLGWLLSAASALLVVVGVMATRQEIARNRQASLDYAERVSAAAAAARVLILVVTDRERDAVLAAAHRLSGTPPSTDSSGDRVIYSLGRVAGTEVMLARAGEQGTASAAGMPDTARAAIRRCRPDYVILTGICYGLRPDQGQQIGDVIVARRVHHIDPRKVTDQPGQPVIPRGVNAGCSPRLLDRFHDGQRTWTATPAPAPAPVPARAHTGTVLCSSMLVNSRAVVAQLRRDYPDAIAGEMEGIAVYEAAAQDPKPDWIMVKAISDWGYGKTDRAHALAAGNAADLVLHVIANGGLRRWQGHAALPFAPAGPMVVLAR
jgi:nucleoside phosphorylase